MAKWKMDPKKKRRWLKALRSRSYRQGREALKQRENGRTYYCCLGVYGQVVAPKNFTDLGAGNYVFLGDGGLLPPTMIPKRVQNKLARMNDVDRCSFKQIADWVEKNT